MENNPSVLKTKKTTMLAWLLTLAVVWLLWSGLYEPLLLGLGALSCLLTVYIVHRTGFFRQSTLLHMLPRIPKYGLKLFVEIVKSNIDVTRIILDPRLPISPTEIEMEAAPKGPVGQAILGNSITLSPGTVTIDVHEGLLRVHCLTREGAEALVASNVNQRSAELTDK